MSRFGAWERVRVHDADGFDDGQGQFTIKDKIREHARKSLVDKEAGNEEARVRGLRKHPHYPQASNIRWYNRFTCLSAVVSLVLGIWQVLHWHSAPCHLHRCLQNEIHWESYQTVEPTTAAQGPIDIPDHDPSSRELLKWIVTANVIVVGARSFTATRCLSTLLQ